MDLAILFEAIGNLLLVTILFVAVLISAALSVITYVIRSINFRKIKPIHLQRRLTELLHHRAELENTTA